MDNRYLEERKKHVAPITCIEIMDAIDDLVCLRIKSHDSESPQILFDQIEMARRKIVDGLQQHSASKGIYVK